MDLDLAGFCGLNQSGPARVYKKSSNLKHSYCVFVVIYRVFIARFVVFRAVLIKPQVSCDITPGIYRMFFERFDVSQSSADEASGLLRCYAWYIQNVL